AAHLGAFFELLLNDWLCRSELKPRLHPTIPGAAGQPDFLIPSITGVTYLEATSTTGLSNAEKRANRFSAEVIDAVAGIRSPDFCLFADIDEEPTSQPSAAKVREQVTKWIASLDYDAIRATGVEGSETAATTFEAGGGRFRITPFAKDNTRGTEYSLGG